MNNFIGRRVKVDISKTKNKAIIKMMSQVEGMLLTPIKKIKSPMGDNYYICAETKNKCIYEEVLVLQKEDLDNNIIAEYIFLADWIDCMD